MSWTFLLSMLYTFSMMLWYTVASECSWSREHCSPVRSRRLSKMVMCRAYACLRLEIWSEFISML